MNLSPKEILILKWMYGKTGITFESGKIQAKKDNGSFSYLYNVRQSHISNLFQNGFIDISLDDFGVKYVVKENR